MKYFFCFSLIIVFLGNASAAFLAFADTCGQFGPPHVEPGHYFCANEEFQDLAALPIWGGELFWYADELLTEVISTGSFCTPINTIGTTTYYVVAIEGECVSEIATVNTTIFPIPEVHILPDSPVFIYPEDSIYLVSNTDVNNQWSDNSQNDSLLITGPGMYTLTIEDVNNCFNSDTAYVRQNDTTLFDFIDYSELIIPNSFTPNGDGLNDVFAVFTNDLKNFELQIFNRWGDLVFETRDPNQAWTGGENFFGSNDQYVYYIRYNYENEQLFQFGTLNLLR